MPTKPKGERIKQIRNSTKSVFKEWWDNTTPLETDSWLRKLYKFLWRIAGIVAIVVISPVIGIVLIVAFIVVL